MSIRRDADFEFLDAAVEPVGEFEAHDVPFSLTSKIAVPGGKIPDESNESKDVEDRTFSCPVGPAKDAKGLEACLESDKAPEVVCIEPSDRGVSLPIFAGNEEMFSP